jgi:predicted nuclease of predicted toxin-antitoxin system
MQFLVDAQLPPALARWITDQSHQAVHVFDISMMHASDREIWDYAASINAVIVTKDEEFALRPAFSLRGPAVLWIRRGNTSNRELLTWFSVVFPDAIAALERSQTIIEII